MAEENPAPRPEKPSEDLWHGGEHRYPAGRTKDGKVKVKVVREKDFGKDQQR